MRNQHYIALIHPIEEEVKKRIDFNSEIKTQDIFEFLKLQDYKIYQYILSDYQYVMPLNELKERYITFDTFEKEVSTWFGLGKKVEKELLIYPKDGFYYPYGFGSYFYLYSKKDIQRDEFIEWMDDQFPNRFSDFDDTHAGINWDSIKLLHQSDYILVTNNDYQNEFGITAKKEICNLLKDRFEKANFEDMEMSEYIQPL